MKKIKNEAAVSLGKLSGQARKGNSEWGRKLQKKKNHFPKTVKMVVNIPVDNSSC